MDVPLLVAVSGAAEAQVVTAAEGARGLVVARRCADLSELTAAAAAGLGRVALVSPDLRRLDRDSLAALRGAGVCVVGVLPAAGAAARRTGAGSAADATVEEAQARAGALGITRTVACDADPVTLTAAVLAAVGAGEDPSPTPGSCPDSASNLDCPDSLSPDPDPDPDPAQTSAQTPARDQQGQPRRQGRLVAVWGTAGAPGRTTVASTLAAECAAAGAEVMLADVDTWAASVAQTLGLLDESAGIAAACRAAAVGSLTLDRLRELAPLVLPRLRVLTGLPRAERWPELGSAALEGVWEAARGAADWVVADCAAPIEADEEIGIDVGAPRRNGAALAALGHADVVLLVGSADPVGLQRLVRARTDLAEILPHVIPRVVVTKVRASAVGASPGRAVREALERFAGIEDVVLVPDDRPATDAALLSGRLLTEVAPSSPARAALRALAAELMTSAAPSGASSGGPAEGGVIARASRWKPGRRAGRPGRREEKRARLRRRDAASTG